MVERRSHARSPNRVVAGAIPACNSHSNDRMVRREPGEQILSGSRTSRMPQMYDHSRTQLLKAATPHPLPLVYSNMRPWTASERVRSQATESSVERIASL